MRSAEREGAAVSGTARKQRKGFSLRSKILLVLTLVVGAYAVFDSIVRESIVEPTFSILEQTEAKEDVERIREALLQEITMLHQFALNWSQYDGTYEFVPCGPLWLRMLKFRAREQFARANFAPARLAANHVDFLLVCDREGNMLWHHLADPDNPGEEQRLRMFRAAKLVPSHPLLAEEKSGLLLTELGPMLLSSRPLLPSSGEGVTRGTLILGRFLSKRLDYELTRQTKVDFDFWQLDGQTPLPEAESAILDELTTAPSAYVVEGPSSKLFVYETFPDISNRPDFLIRANVPRVISSTGASATRYALLSMFGACLIGLLALQGLLQRIVLSPVSALTAHAVRIGQEEDFSAKLNLERNDEIGILARELDAMMQKLEKARRDLMETARAAGMSEIATGILHNVGNVLNSVNISASLIAERAQDLGTNDLSQLARVLEQHREDLADFVARDSRGKQLQSFVTALAGHVTLQRKTILDELGSLTQGIDHIRELIRSQQDYAVRGELVVPVVMHELVDQALGITEKALGRDPDLVVERRFDDLPTVRIDRHKVLEILVNLLQNARQAMQTTTPGIKRLTISIDVTSDDRLQLAVTDTGIGIPAENLLRIFSLGFTTKRAGHGFGLHASANAAAALGGSLEATSPGPGLGATFTLELPISVARAAEAHA